MGLLSASAGAAHGRQEEQRQTQSQLHVFQTLSCLRYIRGTASRLSSSLTSIISPALLISFDILTKIRARRDPPSWLRANEKAWESLFTLWKKLGLLGITLCDPLPTAAEWRSWWRAPTPQFNKISVDFGGAWNHSSVTEHPQSSHSYCGCQRGHTHFGLLGRSGHQINERYFLEGKHREAHCSAVAAGVWKGESWPAAWCAGQSLERMLRLLKHGMGMGCDLERRQRCVEGVAWEAAAACTPRWDRHMDSMSRDERPHVWGRPIKMQNILWMEMFMRKPKGKQSCWQQELQSSRPGLGMVRAGVPKQRR